MGQNVLPETCPLRVIIREMINENPIASQLNPGDEAKFLRLAEDNGAYFGRFRPGYFMNIGPTSDEAWNFGKYVNSPSGRCEWLARGTVEVYEESEFPIFTGTHHFLQSELQQGGQNMHFTASDLSHKALVKLILPASAISMVYCLSEHPRGAAEGCVASSSPSKDGDIHPSAASSLNRGNFCNGSNS